jgi:hypothetical protein
MPDAALLGRGLLAGVLILAVLAKSSNRESRIGFLTVIDELSPWPSRWSELLAGSVLAAELAVIGALLVPAVPAAIALPAAIMLLLAFTLALLTLLGSGTSTSCACFGAWSRGQVGTVAISRNLVLIGLAVLSLGLNGGHGRANWTAIPAALLLTLAIGLLVRIAPAGRRHRPAAGPS